MHLERGMSSKTTLLASPSKKSFVLHIEFVFLCLGQCLEPFQINKNIAIHCEGGCEVYFKVMLEFWNSL